MFKVSSIATIFVVGIAFVCPVGARQTNKDQTGKAQTGKDQPPLSPTETITEAVGGAGGPKVTITYSRPYTKDPKSGEMRKIWGTLVPWGKAWRTGANMATAFETEAALVVGGAAVPAGKYTIYMIPEEKGPSKLAISKTTGQKGEPVDEKNDLVRVDLKKDTLDKSVDQFTIAIATEMGKEESVLKLMWENKQFSVPISVAKK